MKTYIFPSNGKLFQGVCKCGKSHFNDSGYCDSCEVVMRLRSVIRTSAYSRHNP